MGIVDYKYFTRMAALDQRFPDRRTKVLFREADGVTEVRVRRLIPAPDDVYSGEDNIRSSGVSFKTYMKTLRNKSKGLKEVKINTEISTSDGYGHDWPSATIVITGWTTKLSNGHKMALGWPEVTKKNRTGFSAH